MHKLSVLLDGYPDPATAAELFDYAVGPNQGLFDWVRELVAQDDREGLQALYSGQSHVHTLLDTHAPPYGRPVAELGFPYRKGESAYAHAARALAATGLASLDPTNTEFADTARRWHAAANASLSVNGESLPLAAGISALRHKPTHRRRQARIGVVTASGSSGQAATLHAVYDRRLPRGIAADPATMSMFAADPQFWSALDAAYHLAGKGLPGGVLFTVDTDDQPIGFIEGQSMGAAFCVVLGELVARRVWRWPWQVRRMRERTYVVGKVTPSGHVQSVSEYPAKSRALGDLARLIVPKDDLGKVPDIAAAVIGVSNWRQAARAAHRIDRWAATARTVAATLVLAAAATLFGVEQHRNAERDRGLQTASRLAEAANARVRGDSDGTALLLAMASDDLFRLHGRDGALFPELARDHASLLKIVRPPVGHYNDGALAPDSANALLSTRSGLVQIISTKTGAVEWERQYPPGIELLTSQQVFITALAFGAGGKAAYATNNRQVVVLHRAGAAWQEAATVDLAVPSVQYASGVEHNHASRLAFQGDRLLILGRDKTFGLLSLSLNEPRAAARQCLLPPDAVHLGAVEAGRALVTYADQVVSVDPTTCHHQTTLKAPAGVTLHATEAHDGVAVSLGVKEAEIMSLKSDGSPPAVLASSGPYANVRLSTVDDGLEATASTSGGTFGWRMAQSAQTFAFRAGGAGLRGRDRLLLWIHDGIVELHNPTRGLLTTVRRFFYPALSVRARWAGPHLIIGRSMGGVTMVRNADQPLTGDSTTDVRLQTPEGLNDVWDLAADPQGTVAAAIVYTSKRQHSQRLAVWDLPTLTPVAVELPAGVVPISITYLDGRIYVGARERKFFALQFREGAWRVAAETLLDGNAATVVSSTQARNVAVMTVTAQVSSPTVATLDPQTLAVVQSRHLPEASGPWQLAALRNGGYVAAYSTGKIFLLDASLATVDTIDNLRFPYVDSVVQVPARDEIIVSGLLRSVTIDLATFSVLRDERWGRAGNVMGADTSHDQRLLATYDWADQYFTVWVMDVASLRQRVCDAIGRELTRQEWRGYAGDEVPYRTVCGLP